jgi:hypothetical protein
MKLTNKITTLATAAGLALAAGTASAAVTYGGSFQSWNASNTTNTSNFIRTGSGFDASGFDKLVVVATSENGNGGTGGVVDTMTYDGLAMTLAAVSAGEAGNITFTSIWYLDNPTTTAGVIATTGNNRIAGTAFGLNGTAAGFGNTVSVKGVYTSSLASSAGSMVISSLGMGGSGNNADVNNATPNTGTKIDGEEFGNNWAGHVAAYDAAGGGTYAFTDTSPTNDVGIAAVEFTMIPEPSTTALLGLGGLALIFRRRK